MALEECILCYETLGVPVFQRNATGDVVIEGDSTRLQCGHAYHTLCLVRSLQHRARCPLCNVLQQQNDGTEESWRQRIEFEGRCLHVLEEVKREPVVREHLADYKAFYTELMGKKKEFDRRVKAARDAIREDMKINQLMSDIVKMRTSSLREFKKAVRAKGSLFTGAVAGTMKYKIDKLLFGGASWYFQRKFSRFM